MCATSLAHLIILGSRYRVIIWAYPHPSIEWRRLGLVSQRLDLSHMGSGNVIIAHDMWVDWRNMSV